MLYTSRQAIKPDAVSKIKELGGWYTATSSGLLIGPSHTDGGILMVNVVPDGSAAIMNTVEGGEYLFYDVNTDQSKKLMELSKKYPRQKNAAFWKDRSARPNIDCGNSYLHRGVECAPVLVVNKPSFILNITATIELWDDIEDLI